MTDFIFGYQYYRAPTPYSTEWKKDLIKIKHGFAISIHKSQGGEFEFVIIPIAKSYSRMLYRKLIYTGVTRAKKKLILLGEEEAFKMAVSSNYSTERKTNLKNLIIECF